MGPQRDLAASSSFGYFYINEAQELKAITFGNSAIIGATSITRSMLHMG
jgi:hypothetical protein